MQCHITYYRVVVIAFVIGVSAILFKLKRLSGCIHDATRVKNMLVNSLGPGGIFICC